MNETELTQYRKKLQEMAGRLRPDVTAVIEQARGASGGQGGGELTNAPMHIGDRGTEEYLHELNSTLLENEQYLIGEVLAAMERLDDGKYGRCEACGKSIPKERLDAMPYARFCVGCAEANHAGAPANLNAGRPRSPADTLAREGKNA